MSVFTSAGTPEIGGLTTREVKRIIRGLAGLNFVYVSTFPCERHLISMNTLFLFLLNSGADVVEVAPAYDHGKSDITCFPYFFESFYLLIGAERHVMSQPISRTSPPPISSTTSWAR